MVEEEHIAKCSNSGSGGGGGGGRSAKKLKQKKVPQRGMGVAQLEKIILEEQQKKKDVVGVSKPNSIVSNASMQSVPSFRPALVPLPPPPLPPNHRHLHRGFMAATATTMPTNLVGLPYESNPPIWGSQSNVAQRSQHFQQSCSSSMVNVSLGTTSSSSSSVVNFQMEPPSNQSYSGNNYPPLWPDEDKMVGMKRSYPFSMENMPIPSFNCKFPFSSISRSDESTSCSNGGTTSLITPNPSFRENPSSLGSITDQTTKKHIDENRGLTKDFLTLAPPQASNSSSKEKLAPLPIGQTKNPSGGGEWSNQQPLHSFFPTPKTLGTSNGEAGEQHVDLNLKL